LFKKQGKKSLLIWFFECLLTILAIEFS